MESVSYKDSLETIFLKVYVPQVPWELMHCEADCAQHGQLFKQRKMTPLTDFLILTQHKTWECWTFHLRMPCAARCFAFEPHARPVRWPSRQFLEAWKKHTPHALPDFDPPQNVWVLNFSFKNAMRGTMVFFFGHARPARGSILPPIHSRHYIILVQKSLKTDNSESSYDTFWF